MALKLTQQQAKVLTAFRRSAMSNDVHAIARQILVERREEYETTEPASEELRLLVLDAKSTLSVLFEEDITIKE